MTGLIHIHEDDWGMRSLHPVACWAEAMADLESSIEAGQRNRAPDGIGWTDVHVIRQPSVDFTSVALSLPIVAGRLAPVMPRVGRFIATASAGFDPTRRDPYGSYEEDAWCFGYDASCFIKLEAAGDLVSKVWFEARSASEEHLAALHQCIAIIDSEAEAMIVDYWADAAGRVRDADFLTRYFQRIAETA